MERLKRYRWPGNIRELEDLIRRRAALHPQETITTAEVDNEAPLGQELVELISDHAFDGARRRFLLNAFRSRTTSRHVKIGPGGPFLARFGRADR